MAEERTVGVSHNASGFLDAACGVNVRDRGKKNPDDLFSCPHYSLEGLAVGGGVIPKPGINTAGNDALSIVCLERGKDGDRKSVE